MLNGESASYSCRCLNIRVKSSKASGEPLVAAPADYTSIYVAEDGVQVSFSQLVLRNRTRGVEIAGTSRCSRYTSVTCLVCDILVYRVYQTIPVELEGRNGPLLPTEEWVEQEIMKSSSGWIELRKGCLTEPQFKALENSPNYSSVFSLVLPSPLPDVEVTPQPAPRREYLSHMRSMFPPPGFTPTHPVFVHLSSFALSQSNKLRAVAEDHIADFVLAKVDEVAAAELVVRRQTEALWTKFKEGITKAEQERSIPRSPTSRTGPSPTQNTTESGPVLSIREFVPLSVPPTRPNVLKEPVVSSLSMTRFQHPEYLKESMSGSQSPDNGRPGSPDSGMTLTSKTGAVAGGNVLQYNRNFNEAFDSASSYRYTMNLDQEMARTRPVPPATSTSPVIDDKQEPPTSPVVSPTKSSTKGKQRKVTFATPANGHIKEDDDAEDDLRTYRDDAQEMVFELEEEGKSDRIPDPTNAEQPHIIRSPRLGPHRKPSINGLPESLSALMPSSLPNLRFHDNQRSLPSTNVSASFQRDLKSAPSPASPSQPQLEEDLENSDFFRAEVSKLVAADTPSHRSAWKQDSAAWKVFMGRQKKQEDDQTFQDLPHYDSGIPGSLPIPIKLPPPRQKVTLGSFRPQLSIIEQQPTRSSSAIRKAVYAERDRERALDPGPLDFALEEEDSEDFAEAEQLPMSPNRGRDHALKIIQARSSIPEAGMWRSLAS
ncbi:hypothetical protein C8J56DRAFT_935621 [Mycena floridula]|nr:hypothetical protein C8J56DRAFT_935621 [Mycena floridula]